jgi:hypothetical protein
MKDNAERKHQALKTPFSLRFLRGQAIATVIILSRKNCLRLGFLCI